MHDDTEETPPEETLSDDSKTEEPSGPQKDVSPGRPVQVAPGMPDKPPDDPKDDDSDDN